MSIASELSELSIFEGYSKANKHVRLIGKIPLNHKTTFCFDDGSDLTYEWVLGDDGQIQTEIKVNELMQPERVRHVS